LLEQKLSDVSLPKAIEQMQQMCQEMSTAKSLFEQALHSSQSLSPQASRTRQLSTEILDSPTTHTSKTNESIASSSKPKSSKSKSSTERFKLHMDNLHDELPATWVKNIEDMINRYLKDLMPNTIDYAAVALRRWLNESCNMYLGVGLQGLGDASFKKLLLGCQSSTFREICTYINRSWKFESKTKLLSAPVLMLGLFK
jgi:hypothetical protein